MFNAGFFKRIWPVFVAIGLLAGVARAHGHEALKTIPVGWEITFYHPKLFNEKLLYDPREEPGPRLRRAYNRIYESYGKLAQQHPGELKLGEIYTDRWGNPACTLDLTFEGKTYTFNLSPDPMVLEVGMPPLTHEELQKLAPKVDQYFFDFLKREHGLRPSAGVGSGHQNFGIKTAFGKDPQIATRHLANWSTLIHHHPALALGVLEADSYNAAGLTTQKQITAYEAVIADVRSGAIRTPQEFARAINHRVYIDLELALGVRKEQVIDALENLWAGRPVPPSARPVLKRLKLSELTALSAEKRALARELITFYAENLPSRTLTGLVIDLQTRVFENFKHRDTLFWPSKYKVLRVESFDPAFAKTSELTDAARTEYRANNAPRGTSDMLDQTELFVRSIYESNQIDHVIEPGLKLQLALTNEQKAAQYYHFVNFAYGGKITPEIYRKHARELPKHLRKLEPWKDPRINDLAYVYGDVIPDCSRLTRMMSKALASPNSAISGPAGLLYRLFQR